MAATFSTNDHGGDMGYQTGYFSGTLGSPLDQTFFDAAFAGHVNTNKVYKEAYNCNIIGECNMSSWLEAFGGVETYCYPAYTMLEYNGFRNMIKAVNSVAVPAYPSTANITLNPTQDHFVTGRYVLPQVGNTIALTPSGKLAKVTVVTHATAYDTVITVQMLPGQTGGTVNSGDEMLVFAGADLADCACPTGQFRFRDMPIEHDIVMRDIAVKGELCGDALEKCQFLKIPFLDDNGNVIEERWYTQAQQDMYRDLERTKHYTKLLDPTFGVIPTIRARGMKFSPASTSAIDVQDIRDFKKQLDKNGVAGREFAVFAGRDIFSQFQTMLLAAGVAKLDNTLQPNRECKWINLEYCGIQVEGLTLHIYDECSFSNGKELGAVGYNFAQSAIFVPLWNAPKQPEYNIIGGRNGYTEKMFTTVYFKSIQGRVYDMFTDSNGFLNGAGGRNTFGTGCKEHEWTAETRFSLEIKCANSWAYIGLS